MSRPHAIFQSPFMLQGESVQFPTPDQFRAGNPDLPAQLPTYEIHGAEGLEGGVVGIAARFHDSPDAEWIATGISSMAWDCPAIARHGSFMLWGFHANPQAFTENGRRLFLNVMAYAHAHRSDPVLVRRNATPREYARVPDQQRPFMFWKDGQFELDRDAQALGLPNDSVAMLELIAGRLAKSPDDSVALRLRQRYLPEAPEQGLVAWLAEHRSRLFFSDWGGYRWYLRP